jgi:hypothetical protein
MKNLEKDKLESLLSIMGDNPLQQIVHFSNGGETLVDMLHHYCEPKAYQYEINAIENTFYEETKEKFKNSQTTVVRNFSLERKSYLIQAKQYNFAFISIDIQDDFKEDFLRRVHRIILNAGNILIFIPKSNISERYRWIDLLEETYYVATSTIDDLFEHYDVIISKKMHGWGS